MAIFQSDAYFRRIVELTLQDIRENDWLLDDILSQFVTDPMLAMYGQKEIENAKKWFKENEISIFLPHRMDTEKMPCITISVGSSSEDKSLARLADQTAEVETLLASDIGKTIQYVIKPFTYISYIQVAGFFEVHPDIDLTIIRPGMVVIDPETGGGYVIIKTGLKPYDENDPSAVRNNGIFIAPNTVVSATEVGILPQYRIWRARREIATFQERITLGCHTHGDPSSLLWLHSIMMYAVLRYREGVLESRNFQLSTIEISDMVRNSNFEHIGENVYSRFITVTGQTEQTWLKAPKRIIEAAVIKGFDDGEGGCPVGICITGPDGGQIPEIIDTSCETWAAKDEEE